MGRKPANPYRRPDRYTREAKEQGYAARSVFKLREIQQRLRILKPGQRIVDLGCSPGSWLTYSAEVTGPSGSVLGVDIEAPAVSVGTVLVKSVLEVEAEEITAALGGAADVVLSDMAPRTTGDPTGDHFAQIELASAALRLAAAVLSPGGHFVCKVFDGEDAPAFAASVRAHFREVKRIRPDAVRQNSREFFLVGLGFVPVL